MGLMFPMILFVMVFYFLILRPQKTKQKQHEKMIASINRGDTVITAGGFWGKVSDVLEDSFIIEISDGVKARIAKGSISVKREGPDSKPRQPRPKKKDRPRRERAEGTAGEDTAPDSAEVVESAAGEEVTQEEKVALIEGDAAETTLEAEVKEAEQK